MGKRIHVRKKRYLVEAERLRIAEVDARARQAQAQANKALARAQAQAPVQVSQPAIAGPSRLSVPDPSLMTTSLTYVTVS